MSLGATLDVAIGLVFTYLLLGIFASGLREAYVAALNKRGKQLQDAIATLLSSTGGGGLGAGVLGHSLIADLSPKNKPPSYVPARNFALALLDTLKAGGQGPLFSEIERAVAALPAGAAKQSIAALVTQAAGDVAALQKGVETWFDDAMDRVTGIYKRHTAFFTFCVGLGLAVVFNVDSIQLARTLWTQEAARNAAVAAAVQYQDEQSRKQPKPSAPTDKPAPSSASGAAAPAAPPATSAASGPPAAANAGDQTLAEKQLQETAKLLDKLPIGWVAIKEEAEKIKQETKSASVSPWQLFTTRLWASDCSGGWMVIGWLITAMATSLGAPFWFGALGNLLQLRNAGPKPARSDAPDKKP